MLPGSRCRVVAEVVSHFRDRFGKPVIKAKAGDVVTVIRNEAHNNLVTVELAGERFATQRTNLIPVPSKSLF